MHFQPPAVRWCHLTCSTVKHHKFFNIAALARFCERALVEECARHGWESEAAMLPDRFHVLVAAPAAVSRDELVRAVRSAAAVAAKRARAGSPVQRVWETSCWCSVITSGTALEAVRNKLRSIRS